MSITIELEVDDRLPDGVRRAHDGYWRGEALICSREKIDQALKGDTLDVSGVYILFGTKESQGSLYPEDRIYIGSGDSVRDRIESHNRKKLFWRTAVIFYRPGEELHYGNIRYIEARLVERARKTKVDLLDNQNSPRLPGMPESAKRESEEFVERIVLYLRALGLDFFTPHSKPILADTDDDNNVIDGVPPSLRQLVSNLKSVLEKFPDTVFYATKTPDVRAKVVVGNAFRVFARLKFRADGIRLQLKEIDDNIFVPADDLDAVERLRPKIESAYKLAVRKVQGVDAASV